MNIFLTGGQRGIGCAVKTLAENAGAIVVAPRRHDCDLLAHTSVSQYISTALTDIPPFDACVLNAHEWFAKPFADQSLSDLDTQWTYVKHHWLLMQHLLLHQYVRCVVVVASLRGIIGGVNSGPYSMAKAAMVNMVLGFAREYPGVRFHAVCPGLTATDMEQEVRDTGGVSNPATQAQSPACVAQIILGMIVGDERNTVVCINQGKKELASWILQ